MGDVDLLMEVLRLARQEGALEGERLDEFGKALGERAALIVGERVTQLEAQVRGLEEENAWRREGVEALEAEVAALRAQGTRATEAHDLLLAHHRDVLSRAAAEMEAVAALPLYRGRQGQRRLADLARSLRAELA